MTDQGITCKIINRQMLTDTVMEITIESYQEVKVIPGQWALFLFEDKEGPFQRCYSILDRDTDNERTMLIFAIKLSEQGRGSAQIKNTPIGSEVHIQGVYGNFVLQNTLLPKVFVGTGTGVVPLLNMAKHCDTKKELFFSVSYKKDLFYEERIKKIHGLDYHISLSREELPGYSMGRIDFSTKHFDPDTEFYVCGKPEVINDIIKKLESLGFKRIYRENF